MRPYPERDRLMTRICQLVSYGYRLTKVGTMAGMPAASTICGWARDNATFAAQLKEAQAEGRRVRPPLRTVFDPAVAEAFLGQVRQGRLVNQLLREPGGPNWQALHRWLRDEPAFAAAYAEALRRRPRRPRPRRPFDQAVADRIFLRVLGGERVAQVTADPALPGAVVLRRWRREQPAFHQALRDAMIVALRRRMRSRGTRCTPAMAAAVVARIRAGESLNSLARRGRGFPTVQTLYRWFHTQPDFARAVSQAYEDRDQALMEKAVEIADGATPETAARVERRVKAIWKRLGQLTPHPGDGPRLLG